MNANPYKENRTPNFSKEEQIFWDNKGTVDYVSLSDHDVSWLKSAIVYKPGDIILDLGGGSGMMSRIIDRSSSTVVCADISHNMLKHSPALNIQSDAKILPFANNSFDIIIAAAFLHHMPGHEDQVFEECYRVLKPGGIFYGYDPNGHSLQNKIFMQKNIMRLDRFSPDEMPIYPNKLDTFASKAGFKKERMYYFSFRYKKVTMFELIQRYLLTPLAKGVFRKIFHRWFFWTYKK